jgi:CO/xanthine dehydrogenase Mo-binding subunit
VRYVGDGVALIAAETEEIAIEALKKIEVEYELLPAVFSPVDALKSNAPRIHETGNLIATVRIRKGETAKGFTEADVILERTYTVPFLEHAYIEPDVVLAIPHPDGTMTVKGPMQAPFTVRRNITLFWEFHQRLIVQSGEVLEKGFIDIWCRAALWPKIEEVFIEKRGNHAFNLQTASHDHPV